MASPIRKLDRRDGLIFMLSPMVAVLGVVLVPTPRLPISAYNVGGLLPDGILDQVPAGVSVSTTIDTSLNAMARLVPFLTAWTAALWMIRMRRPRAPWRRMISQPGLAACSVGLLVLAVVLATHLVRWAAIWGWEAIVPSPPGSWSFSPESPLKDAWSTIYFGFAEGRTRIAEAVAATWLVMLLGGWWRPEKSGIDRLGRALGAGWIVLMIAGFAESFLD